MAEANLGNVIGPPGVIQQIVPGNNVSVNNSDPAYPVVSALADMQESVFNSGGEKQVQFNKDVSLNTDNKTVPGAINEILSSLNNLSSRVGKIKLVQLWSGSWSSGNITITGLGENYLFAFQTGLGPGIAIRIGNTVYGYGIQMDIVYGTQYIPAWQAIVSGNILMLSWISYIPHLAGGNHGVAGTDAAINNLYSIGM